VTPLSHALIDRARAYLEGAGEVAVPRHAATVVLLRDGAGGLEVYLLRRTATMAFAAGMYVFPGGSVDPRDGQHSPAWAGPDDTAWATALGCDVPLARALVCAAVRETFEESGVLLAGAPDAVVPDTTGDDWERDRQALLDRSQSLAGLVETRGLVVRSDLLRAWAHWITPEFEPRRFDTRFFVAAVPAGQLARDISGEADQAVWLPLADAVAGYEDGRFPMLPPTIVTLRELRAYADVADVLGADATVTPITAITPRPVLDGEAVLLVVDLPEGERRADEVMRGRA
jgi:8-oxo-dGTP pyrophosphatase MutT (NUDIX family)